jgi:peptidoglycan/xylan/chitin deacetylase (PgdA/CDA1 family)
MGALRQRFRDLRRALRLAGRARALVLLYHRVAEPEADPQLLSVSPRRFDEHLEALKRHFGVVSLAELERGLDARKLPARTVVLTFDDGYADNLLAARPILARHGAPATVYVSSGGIGGAGEFWWDELERLLLWTPRLPPRLELTVEGRLHAFEVAGPAYGELPPAERRWSVLQPPGTARERAYAALATLLHPLPPAARDGAIAALQTWAGAGAAGRPTHRALTADELRALADGGLVEIGAHTVTHARLSSLDRAAQAREIVDGKVRLEEVLGRPLRSFSYPFGYKGSYGPETVELVREAGFRNACSNFTGAVLARTDRFQLPRFVVRDWDGDELLRRVERWHAVGA